MKDKIYTWFEDYKKRFKVITLEITDSKFFDETTGKIEEGYILTIYSNVLEDLSIILSKFRYYSGIQMPHFEEYDFSGYDPGINPFEVSYNSLEEVNFRNFKKNCKIAIETTREDFPKFFKEFENFCSEWRFIIGCI